MADTVAADGKLVEHWAVIDQLGMPAARLRAIAPGPLTPLGPRYDRALTDCSVSSEPRKNTIFPSAKRHQCCMYIAVLLPVALAV